MMVTQTPTRTNLLKIDYNPFEDGFEIEKIVAMNDPQRLIWLSCTLGGEGSSLAYNESISLDFTGKFNLELFQEAVTEVVLRHEALRSAVSANGESMIVYHKMPFYVGYSDISSAAEPKQNIKVFIDGEMKRTFNLQKGPLLRTFIHKLSSTHYYFTIVSHHMVCDGWSFGIILENISKIYNAKLKGLTAELGKADQISDYAIEMAQFKNSEAHQQVKDYWLNLYKDGAPVVDFPTDYPRPLNRNYKSNRIDHGISLELVEKLKKLGTAQGASLVNTLISAFEVFIYLKTNQTDLILGVPTAGQAATEKFEMVGHCVNLLALRSRIDPQASFSAYLATRKKEFFDAYENQKFTLGELVQSLEQRRDFSRIPIIPIIFNVDMGLDSAVNFNELDYKLISNPRVYETFEIFLNATGSKSSFELEWSYNTQLFKAATIRKISGEFEALLETIATDPGIKLQTLAQQSTADWELILQKNNDTAAHYDKNSTLTAVVEQAAAQYPAHVAISAGKVELTYKTLSDRAGKMANHLLKHGVKTGDVVAVAMGPSPDLLVAILGIFKAGGVYLMLDTEWPDKRIAYLLADAEAKIILTAHDKASGYESKAVQISLNSAYSESDELNDISQAPVISGQNLAYIHYVAHNSGRPMALKVKHFNLLNLIISLNEKPGMKAGEKLLSLAGSSSEMFLVELFTSLISGAEFVFSGWQQHMDPQMIADLIRKKDINVVSGNAFDWKKLMEHEWTSTSTLRIWSYGELLKKEITDELLDRAAKLWSFYGRMEGTVVATLKEIVRDDEGINLGWPINNTKIFIYNQDNTPTAPGKIGEIVIAGDGVTEGEWKMGSELSSQENAEAAPYQRFFHTGDLGKFSSNGDLQYLGRLDNQVNIGGNWIVPKEIELLLEKQENVSEVIVLAKEDRTGTPHLLAYVTLKEETDDENSLIAAWQQHLSGLLPSTMRPENFIILEDFPRTLNNEIDRLLLPKPKATASSTQHITQLQGETEHWIMAIWNDILGLKEIDREDDFFEIGGNSMLAVRMMAEVEKHTGERLPLATLLKNSTVAQLAKRILSENEEGQAATIVPVKTSGSKTPVYLVHGAGLNILLFKSITKYFDKEQPIYGIQAFGLNGEVNIPPTIEEIAQKHIMEMLTVDSSGPYAIAGYSLGGYIAFEMAKQLQEMGKEVSFLGIIDTYAYNKQRFDNESFKILRKVRRQFFKAQYFAKSFMANPKESYNYQVFILKNKLFGVILPDKIVKQTTATAQEGEIYKIYANAYEHYELKKQDLKIHLFRVQKRLYYLDDRKYLGWADLSTREVEICVVPGDHKTFLQAPNDEQFARVLQHTLDGVCTLS